MTIIYAAIVFSIFVFSCFSFRLFYVHNQHYNGLLLIFFLIIMDVSVVDLWETIYRLIVYP